MVSCFLRRSKEILVEYSEAREYLTRDLQYFLYQKVDEQESQLEMLKYDLVETLKFLKHNWMVLKGRLEVRNLP